MPDTLSLETLNAPIRLKEVGEALAGDMRPLWRMAIILSTLSEGSSGKTASLEKIQVVNWMIRQPARWDEFKAILSGQLPLFRFNVEFDPSIHRAVNFAVGEKLIEFTPAKRLALTVTGSAAAAQVSESGDILQNEIQFLRSTKRSLTEAKIASLLNWESVA